MPSMFTVHRDKIHKFQLDLWLSRAGSEYRAVLLHEGKGRYQFVSEPSSGKLAKRIAFFKGKGYVNVTSDVISK